MKHLPKTLAVALVPLALAACGGGGGSGGAPVATPPPTPPTTTAFSDKFGTAVSASFNAAPTTDPKDPLPSDVPALSVTADPLDN